MGVSIRPIANSGDRLTALLAPIVSPATNHIPCPRSGIPQNSD